MCVTVDASDKGLFKIEDASKYLQDIEERRSYE